MSKAELENLARIGKLVSESPSAREFDRLLASGNARLADAKCEVNSHATTEMQNAVLKLPSL